MLVKEFIWSVGPFLIGIKARDSAGVAGKVGGGSVRGRATTAKAAERPQWARGTESFG